MKFECNVCGGEPCRYEMPGQDNDDGYAPFRCVWNNGRKTDWCEVKEKPQGVRVEHGVASMLGSLEWGPDGDRYYLSGHCPGCKEKDATINRQGKTISDLDVDIRDCNKKIISQFAEVEMLRERVDHLEVVRTHLESKAFREVGAKAAIAMAKTFDVGPQLDAIVDLIIKWRDA